MFISNDLERAQVSKLALDGMLISPQGHPKHLVSFSSASEKKQKSRKKV